MGKKIITGILVFAAIYILLLIWPAKESEQVEEAGSYDINLDLSEMPVELNSRNFALAIDTGLVLVDFWAEWCRPCHIQKPIIEDLSTEVSDWAIVAKVNIDNYPDIAQRYGVRSIPALLIFNNGKLVNRFSGIQQKDILIAALEEFK